MSPIFHESKYVAGFAIRFIDFEIVKFVCLCVWNGKLFPCSNCWPLVKFCSSGKAQINNFESSRSMLNFLNFFVKFYLETNQNCSSKGCWFFPPSRVASWQQQLDEGSTICSVTVDVWLLCGCDDDNQRWCCWWCSWRLNSGSRGCALFSLAFISLSSLVIFRLNFRLLLMMTVDSHRRRVLCTLKLMVMVIVSIFVWQGMLSFEPVSGCGDVTWNGMKSVEREYAGVRLMIYCWKSNDRSVWRSSMADCLYYVWSLTFQEAMILNNFIKKKS